MDVVGAATGVKAADVTGTWDLETENVGVLDAPVPVVGGLAVVGLDDALDTPVSPPSCELVHRTGF